MFVPICTSVVAFVSCCGRIWESVNVHLGAGTLPLMMHGAVKKYLPHDFLDFLHIYHIYLFQVITQFLILDRNNSSKYKKLFF